MTGNVTVTVARLASLPTATPHLLVRRPDSATRLRVAPPQYQQAHQPQRWASAPPDGSSRLPAAPPGL